MPENGEYPEGGGDDPRLVLKYKPTIKIVYKGFEVAGSPVPIALALTLPDFVTTVENNPCNSRYSPPLTGANQDSCCGFIGPEFCKCKRIECMQSCLGWGVGLRLFELVGCDELDIESSIPKCKCLLSKGVMIGVIAGLVTVIICFCCVCVCYCKKKCDQLFDKAGGGGGGGGQQMMQGGGMQGDAYGALPQGAMNMQMQMGQSMAMRQQMIQQGQQGQQGQQQAEMW